MVEYIKTNNNNLVKQIRGTEKYIRLDELEVEIADLNTKIAEHEEINTADAYPNNVNTLIIAHNEVFPTLADLEATLIKKQAFLDMLKGL